MRSGIELTERDIQILSFLKEQGVATSEQLTLKFFNSSSAFRVRVGKLIKSGLIEAVPLLSGIHHVPSRMAELRSRFSELGKRWQQTKIYRLSKQIYGKSHAQPTGLGEPIFWQHQLGLNEIRNYFEYILRDGVFISDPESKREWARYKFGSNVPIPDLVWRKESTELAFEYERTNKGEERYSNRMISYQRSNYKRVLFVANTDEIAEVLMRWAMRFPKIGVSMRSHLQKVYIGASGYLSTTEFLLGD